MERGWVARERLAEAIDRQGKLGGRLGTCLLEVGALSEALLLKALSEQLGVPSADIPDLRRVPEEVFGLLPGDVAGRYKAIPFRSFNTRVDVALLDVHDLALRDDLAFVLGKELNVHIANEARIYEALALYYGKPSPVRFAGLLERLNRERERLGHQRATARPTPAPPAAEATAPEPEASPAPPLPVADHPAADAGPPPEAVVWKTRGSIPISDDDLDSLGFAPPQAGEGPETTLEAYEVTPTAPEQVPLDGVETLLQEARTPQQVGDALLRYLSGEFVRVLLFRVTGGSVRGWTGHGPSLDLDRFERYAVELAEPSIFLNLHQGGSFFLGQLAPMPPHVELAACWGEEPAHECAVLPIRVRDRLVSLIYGDRDCLGLNGLDLGAMRRLCTKASIAFELCIMQQKLKRA